MSIRCRHGDQFIGCREGRHQARGRRSLRHGSEDQRPVLIHSVRYGRVAVGKADLHAHTCHDGWGDGNQTVERLLRYVEEKTDLDLFAITDHDSTDAAHAAWLKTHPKPRARKTAAAAQ